MSSLQMPKVDSSILSKKDKISLTGAATPGEYAKAKSLFDVIGFDEFISILPDLFEL